MDTPLLARSPSVMLRVDRAFADGLRLVAEREGVSVPEVTRYHPKRLGQLLALYYRKDVP